MKKERYELLFRTHYRAMYRYAYCILYDAEEARDAVSEVWSRLLLKEADIDDDTADAYLKRLVHNQCVNVLLHKKVEEKAQKLMPQELETALTNEDITERERKWEEVLQFIRQSLSPRTQEIVRMRYVDNLSYKQMAEILAVSTSAINKHLTEALSRLRNTFRQ